MNMATDGRGAREFFIRLHQACDHFLSGVSLDLTGAVPRDPGVRDAVVSQKPFCIEAPDSPAALAVAELAQVIAAWQPPENLDGNIKFFWKKLLFH